MFDYSGGWLKPYLTVVRIANATDEKLNLFVVATRHGGGEHTFQQLALLRPQMADFVASGDLTSLSQGR